MERLLRSSEKMSKARKDAIAKLRAMSFDELVALGHQNADSTTVEFLSSANAEVLGIIEKTDKQMLEEYSVAAPSFFFEQFVLASHAAVTVTRKRTLGALAPFSYEQDLVAA
ncbi:MAG: hypothetical protein OZ926_14580 [Pseudomonas sp.]|nr:hypothetical protein [Pseudomonas sp.]